MIGHKDFTTRPATRADIEAFFGDAKPKETMRALVAEYRGEVVAIGAAQIDAGATYASSDFKEGLQYSPRAALRFARAVVAHCVRGRHVRAMSHRANEKFLNKLGFRRTGAWQEYEVYEWK